MLLDAAGSIGAMAAGTLVLIGVRGADAVIAALLAALIAIGTWGVLKEALDVLLEATPSHISLEAVRDAITAQSGVLSVHDLHVWTLTSGRLALSAHVVAADATGAQSLLVPLRELVYHDFGIGHATLQMETPDLVDEPVHCVDDPRCL
jgi:cobalt-zinc-cadmium efflux system protein